MSDPDSIVEYVRGLDKRYNRLRDAVLEHRANKTERALRGTVDAFDRELWSIIDRAFPQDD